MEILTEFKWHGQWVAGAPERVVLREQLPCAFLLQGICTTLTADTDTNRKKFGFSYRLDLKIGLANVLIFSEYVGSLMGPPMRTGTLEYAADMPMTLTMYREDRYMIALDGGVEIDSGDIKLDVALIGVRLPLSVTSTYVPA